VVVPQFQSNTRTHFDNIVLVTSMALGFKVELLTPHLMQMVAARSVTSE
jgi:hypothetical protein